jgi:hypothetical protein
MAISVMTGSSTRRVTVFRVRALIWSMMIMGFPLPFPCALTVPRGATRLVPRARRTAGSPPGDCEDAATSEAQCIADVHVRQFTRTDDAVSYGSVAYGWVGYGGVAYGWVGYAAVTTLRVDTTPGAQVWFAASPAPGLRFPGRGTHHP